MKTKLILLLILLSMKGLSQDLNIRVNAYLTDVKELDRVEEDYKLHLINYYPSSSKLKMDSVTSDTYSYWMAQSGINNLMKNFKIVSVNYNTTTDSAVVIVDQNWDLDNIGKYIYQVKYVWVKFEGQWFMSDKMPMNISVKPDYSSLVSPADSIKK